MDHRPASTRRRSVEFPRLNPVDSYVGNRIRLLRLSVGISAVRLAERLGTSFQQVGKYENGSDQVTASRIYQIATALGVSVEFFFEGYGLNEADVAGSEPMAQGFYDAIDYNLVHHTEAMSVVRHYQRITSDERRQAILHLVRTLAYEGTDECH